MRRPQQLFPWRYMTNMSEFLRETSRKWACTGVSGRRLQRRFGHGVYRFP